MSDPLVGYNLKLKKKEKMLKPCVKKTTKGKRTTYTVRGVGSDGTKMTKIVSKDTYNELKKKGYKECRK